VRLAPLRWCPSLGVTVESWVDEWVIVLHPSPTRGFECESLETGEKAVILVGEPVRP